jgi:hypothetical protein
MPSFNINFDKSEALMISHDGKKLWCLQMKESWCRLEEGVNKRVLNNHHLIQFYQQGLDTPDFSLKLLESLEILEKSL